MDNPELYKLIGKRIKYLRQQKEMSQLDLAVACNMEKQAISRIEVGGVNSTVSTLNKVAKGLEAPLFELFRCLDKG